MYVCMYSYVCIGIYIYIYIHIYVYIYIFIYIHMHINMHTYIFIHTASNCSTRASDTTAPASTLGSTLTVLNLWVTTAGTTVVGVHTLIIPLLQPTTATYGCAINERHELPTSPLARAGLDNLEMFMGEDTIVETRFFEALRETKFWLATFFFGNSARLRGRHVVRSRPWSICTHSRLPRSIKSTVPLVKPSRKLALHSCYIVRGVA